MPKGPYAMIHNDLADTLSGWLQRVRSPVEIETYYARCRKFGNTIRWKCGRRDYLEFGKEVPERTNCLRLARGVFQSKGCARRGVLGCSPREVGHRSSIALATCT
jgi:hypothetical protein